MERVHPNIKTETVSGIIERILFRSDENGFSVFVLSITKKQEITAKGYAPNIQPGESVELYGSWVMHAKFGKQFDVQKCTIHTPTNVTGLKKYLGSGLIKGIGPAYAEKLVNHFGLEVLDIIDQTPHRLQEVDGIGHKRLEKIISAWKNQKEISKIMVFLQEKGVSTTIATRIHKQYGSESINIITDNPYRIAEDIWGIGFKTADSIAQKLGTSHDSMNRCRAAILHIIATETGNGHLYCMIEILQKKVSSLLDIDDETFIQKIKSAMRLLYNEEKIKLITYQNEHFITLSPYYYSEQGIASKIVYLGKKETLFSFDIDAIYQQLRTDQNTRIHLNEDQQRGIIASLQHKITIITGGPGTGKTTLIKQLLTILDKYKLRYRLAAPTGRAAKRMGEGTGRNAVTLHRLLEFNPQHGRFTHNEQNALTLDFLIIDEASMIDVFLMHSLLKALPAHAHLILIGDSDQLPSVGAGNILHDLIESKTIPSVHLKIIFRQAQDSLIITNAHRVNQGEFPTTYQKGSKQDFIFIKEQDPTNIPQHLQNIYGAVLKKYAISTHNTILLSPMNRGVAGTYKLNHNIQELLNPAKTDLTISCAGYTYRVGDHVIQIRNNYDKLVFNGDIGTIQSIDLQEKLVTIDYADRYVEYDFTDLDEIILAYAISIHKSQGSEFSAVIIPLFMQHFTLLQRNLLYTAITRAKKLCILIGQPKAIAMAIKNNQGNKRITFLKQFLTTDLKCK